MDYTVEVYRVDGRSKQGRRRISTQDFQGVELDQLHKMFPATERVQVEIHETYVTRRNAMTGEQFQERFDTPYYCSPSSETYWSM